MNGFKHMKNNKINSKIISRNYHKNIKILLQELLVYGKNVYSKIQNNDYTKIDLSQINFYKL